ncbi:MAG: hypothetical protein LQ350_005812 [Teloschistes chrysophthalmus]|nr:MAG: hypothetical protein LQ350_005812 [Niorma chrysophthalma]
MPDTPSTIAIESNSSTEAHSPETLDSDLESMDFDAEFHTERNAMMTPAKFTPPFRPHAFPPTPEATPQEVNQGASLSDSALSKTAPIRGIRPTRGVQPSIAGLSSYARKLNEYKATKPSPMASLIAKQKQMIRHHNNACDESASDNDSTIVHHGCLASKKPPIIRPRNHNNNNYRVSKPKAAMMTNKNKDNNKNRLLVSRFELIRVHEAMMEQMDWKLVTQHVACNRSASVYQRAVERVFDAWMEEIDQLEDA